MNTKDYKHAKALSFRMSRLALSIAAAAMIALSACGSKDSDPAPSGNNNNNGGGNNNLSHRMQVITSKTWKVTAATISPAMNGSNDYYAMMTACEKDNTYKLNNNASKTLVIDEGASVCSGQQQTKTSTWTVNTDEDILTMGNTTHKIVAFIDTQFETETQYQNNGTTITIAYRFTAQ